MRAHRIITAIIAFALIGLTPLVGSTASAKSADTASVAKVSTSTSSARAAAPVTKVNAKIIKRRGKLFMVGKVSPVQKGRKVVIDKATRCGDNGNNCNFKRFESDRTNATSHFKVRVFAPRRGSLYWQARSDGVKSYIWRTFRA